MTHSHNKVTNPRSPYNDILRLAYLTNSQHNYNINTTTAVFSQESPPKINLGTDKN